MNLRLIALLLALGVVVGVLFPGRLTALFGEATLMLFIPALIFEAAWNLDFHLLCEHWKTVTLLAVPGVVLTASLIACAVRYGAGLQWPGALLLGAILSATDPVSVVAIFRRLPVPKALATIVESESLFNDALAVVLYRSVLAAVLASSGAAVAGNVALWAFWGVALSCAAGLALATAAAFALRGTVSAPLQSGATLAGAYGAYALCEHFGGSGIFAVVTFGVALRELERHRISVSAAEGVRRFWSVGALAVNAVLFFLIGTALDFSDVRRFPLLAGVTVCAVVAARVAVAYGLLLPVRRYLRPFWRTVVRMAGTRGALSLALAVSLPASLAQRPEILDATFVVVVTTILAGSLTLLPRMKRLRFGEP